MEKDVNSDLGCSFWLESPLDPIKIMGEDPVTSDVINVAAAM